jgi:hypothetical protein
MPKLKDAVKRDVVSAVADEDTVAETATLLLLLVRMNKETILRWLL